MPWSSGTFSRVHNWTADAASAIDIEASRMDQEDDGFATGINTCLTKDGQNTPTANLPMAGNRHTGVGNGAARDDYVAVNQIQDGDLHAAGSVSGTDTITASMTPAVTAYMNSMRVLFLPAATNTGAATLNLNSVGAQSITKNGTTALAAGDLVSGVWADVIYDNANTNWILQNPQTQNVASTTTITAGSGLTGGGDLSANRTVNVGAGTGVTVNADDVALDTANTRNVDHAAITFTAGVGLSGGGTLAANRTFTVDLNELTTETAIASGDFIPMVDITDSGSGKITFANLESALNHDSLTGFVANEHIDHSSVSVTAGTGLSGGGTIAATRTINVDLNGLTTETSIAAGDFLAMVDITDNGSGKITFANLESALNHDSLTGFVVNEHVDHSSVSITAGTGLSGGGTIAASRTLNVDLNELTTETAIAAGDFLAMVDITDSGSGKITFANLEAALNHDSLTGFVADEHVAHSGVSITAGSGLTGGGTIAATRTINVGAGDGVSVAADSVAVDSTVLRTSGSQSVSSDNDSADEVGWKGAPQNIQNGNYTLVIGDAGKQIYKASGGAGETITIPANASVAFPIGTIIEIINDGGGDLSVAITTDTLEPYGGTAGTQTLPDNNKAIIEKVTSTLWKYQATG